MVVKKDCINIGKISGGVVNFGGSVINSPKSVSKSIYAAGQGNTGTIIITNTGVSATNQLP
ncbi:spore germination protein [Bacillus sp. BRMEA1]|uniref:spore germination protein n=1 Tax=Neobacillus endophyticus TaxID=2738405 RepID=UPI00156490E5|nr:spore germination protein [Neobacillus endophyticus]NRD76560.1 spore germination protein [Neobacillus endophyticus]